MQQQQFAAAAVTQAPASSAAHPAAATPQQQQPTAAPAWQQHNQLKQHQKNYTSGLLLQQILQMDAQQRQQGEAGEGLTEGLQPAASGGEERRASGMSMPPASIALPAATHQKAGDFSARPVSKALLLTRSAAAVQQERLQHREAASQPIDGLTDLSAQGRSSCNEAYNFSHVVGSTALTPSPLASPPEAFRRSPERMSPATTSA
ncbi:hypothetical protein cyc_00556 [Cyclospora cayetanensis]|uniref:Uncharacterized protein n=1 Tax=Cyclospora cayetanensis TaxID=88456 RepID=A0A1D3D3D2_9EIME|nr:hypothetical protein cyc_00556 [Cyclospora cayetanensis]